MKKEAPLTENLQSIIENTSDYKFLQVAQAIEGFSPDLSEETTYRNLYSIMRAKKLGTVEEIVSCFFYLKVSALGMKPEKISALGFIKLLSEKRFGCIGTLQRTIPQIQTDFPELELKHRRKNIDKYNPHPTLFENVTHPALSALANYPHPGNLWLDVEGEVWGKPYKQGYVAISKRGMKRVFSGADVHKESYLHAFNTVEARFNGRNSSRLIAWQIPVNSIDRYKKRLGVDDQNTTFGGH
jgi:hypothetical protein